MFRTETTLSLTRHRETPSASAPLVPQPDSTRSVKRVIDGAPLMMKYRDRLP